MITLTNISRFKAATTHLAISAGIAALVLLTMLFLWYPPPLFMAMGGGNLAALIIGVDVTLGPLITLVIFDTRKKSLIFDLAIVVALQLGALGYGIYTLYTVRPAFIVYAEKELMVVSAVDIAPEELAKARVADFRHLRWTGPTLVAVQPASDPSERSSISFIQHYPKYFVPYADKHQQVLEESRVLSGLKLDAQGQEALDKYLKKSTRTPDRLRFLPVASDYKRLTAIIDADSGDLVEILDINPGI